MKRRTILRTLAAALVLAAGTAPAAWPDRPVKMLLRPAPEPKRNAKPACTRRQRQPEPASVPPRHQSGQPNRSAQ